MLAESSVINPLGVNCGHQPKNKLDGNISFSCLIASAIVVSPEAITTARRMASATVAVVIYMQVSLIYLGLLLHHKTPTLQLARQVYVPDH